MKIRIRFAKRGTMRFIGHLDIMRYFQKSMRRAHVDICYSQGFSPHQIMSFASPLGIGLTSEGEYMDIEVNSSESSKAMIRRLNEVMAEGMEILSWVRLPEEGKTNAMANIAAADYRVTLHGTAVQELTRSEREASGAEIAALWESFLEQKEIMIYKVTKTNEMDVDIRPLIFDASCEGDTFTLRLSSGSVQNLKPEAVMEAFFAWAGAILPEHALSICRLDMFALREEKLVSLEFLGEVIA